MCSEVIVFLAHWTHWLRAELPGYSSSGITVLLEESWTCDTSAPGEVPWMMSPVLQHVLPEPFQSWLLMPSRLPWSLQCWLLSEPGDRFLPFHETKHCSLDWGWQDFCRYAQDFHRCAMTVQIFRFKMNAKRSSPIISDAI